MNAIHLYNETGQEIETEALLRAVRTTLGLRLGESETPGEVTILLTCDDQVRALNREHRSVDSVTDILSFPALPHGVDGEAPALGDLVVALPWTARQAQQIGHALTDSLMLLMIHGTLHLLGYTHEAGHDRALMWSVQDKVMQRLGLPADLVPRLEQNFHLKEAR